MNPANRSRASLPANIRKTLEASNLPIEVATAIADLCESRPEAGASSDLLHAAKNAAAKLRYMGQEFSRTNFTDRYGDGPVMLELADKLWAEIKRSESLPQSREVQK